VERYLVVGGVAALGTFLLTFPVRALAGRLGVVVQPDARRVHTRPTPTVGGTAMVLAAVAAMAVAWRSGLFAGEFRGSSEPLGVVLAGVVIYLVGMIDDLREVSAPAKVAGMVLAAMILYYSGVTMYFFKVPLTHQVLVLSSAVTPLVTVLWVVGMANAINLIDGLDGLAAGTIAIAAGAFCVYGIELEHLGLLSTDSIGPLVAAIACGVCVGFLPHNFHPARIFMGDAGALLLGLLMAASTSVVGGRTADTSGHTYFFFAPLLIPLVILGVPILDMAFAIVRRTARRTGLATPDKAHLHHRLLQMGHGHRRSVLLLWAWTAVLSGFVLEPLFDPHANAFIPFAVGGLAIVLLTIFRPGWRRRPEGRHYASAPGQAPGGAGTASVARVPAPVGAQAVSDGPASAATNGTGSPAANGSANGAASPAANGATSPAVDGSATLVERH
jgi:UDP-GlcNAc:undecaprenyl-phosphate GlcNAc-1-phosphate transferase